MESGLRSTFWLKYEGSVPTPPTSLSRIPIGDLQTTVGKGKGNIICLDVPRLDVRKNNAVSDRHALIEQCCVGEGHCVTHVITCLEALEGTYVNGFRLVPNTPTRLDPMDVVTFGGSRYVKAGARCAPDQTLMRAFEFRFVREDVGGPQRSPPDAPVSPAAAPASSAAAAASAPVYDYAVAIASSADGQSCAGGHSESAQVLVSYSPAQLEHKLQQMQQKIQQTQQEMQQMQQEMQELKRLVRGVEREQPQQRPLGAMSRVGEHSKGQRGRAAPAAAASVAGSGSGSFPVDAPPAPSPASSLDAGHAPVTAGKRRRDPSAEQGLMGSSSDPPKHQRGLQFPRRTSARQDVPDSSVGSREDSDSGDGSSDSDAGPGATSGAGGGGVESAPKRKLWRTKWRGSLLTPHCGICGTEHAGGWAAAPAHLKAAHPVQWAHILATGGLASDCCMGCACGSTSFTMETRRGNVWAARHIRVHRALHTAAGVAAAAAAALVCGIDGCDRSFVKKAQLETHQEGPEHLSIRYYCPLTAQHCPRAPCARALGGIPLVGRDALHRHLIRFHKGHSGKASLDLSWAGLVAFLVDDA